MSISETNLILVAVPIGEAHAESSRAIWRRYDCDSAGTLSQKLLILWRAGAVKRRINTLPGGNVQYLYWREAPERVAQPSAPSTVLGAG